MKQIYNFKLGWLLLINTLLLTGCLPHNPAERAAVVIFNDIGKSVNYELELSGKWTAPIKIESNQFDYVLEYDQTDKGEGIARQLTKIKLSIASCNITLHRKDMIKHMAKDPEGRNTWDLHVNKYLLKKFGCR